MDYRILEPRWPRHPSVTDETPNNSKAIIHGNIRDGKVFWRRQNTPPMTDGTRKTAAVIRDYIRDERELTY